MTDATFRRAFEDCSLSPDEFTHDGHLRMAWIYVIAHPLHEAIALFCTDLRRYVTHLGDEAKYHETITWFYMIKVHERAVELDSANSWGEFQRHNKDLFERGGVLLKKNYQPATLSSAKAKTSFILPDLISS